MTEKPGALQVDTALVRQLAELLDDTRLTEIEVQDGDRRIKVVRNKAATAPAAIVAPAATAKPAEAAAPVPDTENAIKSPMVGTVFLAADPDAKPFAGVGDTVAEGATLVIIEAMKVMNPIVAPRAGKVTRVCVQNGQPVEFDQPLIILE